MSPIALSLDPTAASTASNSGSPSSSSSSSMPNRLNLTPAHFTPSGKSKSTTTHFLDLSESTGQYCPSPTGDGTRTPRPRNLTPSPPRSRSGSYSALEGEDDGKMNGNGNGLIGHRNGNGKGRVDDKGRLWKEEEGEVARLMRTIDFAARKHTCQRRKDLDQTPYINHPIAVANFLSSTGITDVRVLQAAILHDTVEDTPTTIEEIEEHFGDEVARIVEECTDNPDLSGQARKAEQIRTAPHKSREAQQVKLADKLHNLESIRRAPPVGWTARRVQAYFIWAKQVTDICAPSHPALGQRLQKLYETAYTEIDGKYLPCHPDVCGPLLEEEKLRIDGRLHHLKKGEKPCPHPIFF